MISYTCRCKKTTVVALTYHASCDACPECKSGLSSGNHPVEAQKHLMILPDRSEIEACCWYCHRTTSQLIDDGVPESLVEFVDKAPFERVAASS